MTGDVTGADRVHQFLAHRTVGVDEQRTERFVAFIPGALRQFDAATEMGDVVLIHACDGTRARSRELLASAGTQEVHENAIASATSHAGHSPKICDF